MPTLSKDNIYNLFQNQHVLDSNQLKSHFSCTYQAIWSHLKKIGYYSSFTHNSQYFTLINIPQFDTNGIWFFNDPVIGPIGFTKYKTANNLIQYLINSSSGGLTEHELEKIIKIRVFSQLKLLTSQAKIKRVSIGRTYYYFSHDAIKFNEQLTQRTQRFGEETQEKSSTMEIQASWDKLADEKVIEQLTVSKEKWRQRSNEKQQIIRQQQIRIRDLQISRDNWKQKALDYKSQNEMLRTQLDNAKNQLIR